jgi:UPF0755 protein
MLVSSFVLRISDLAPACPGREDAGVKKWGAVAGGGLLLLMAGAAAFYMDLQEFGRMPTGAPGEEHVITVEPGTPVALIAEVLERRALIKSAFKFKLLARLEGSDRRLKAGEYSFRPPLAPREILALMEKGVVRLHRLTVPEGLTIHQIAELVEAAGLARAADVLACATDPAYVRTQGLSADSLEGYLFPETYFFPGTVTAEGIIAAMLQRFRSTFSADWERRALELGLTPHEVVTLASLIEKETADPSERPLIASVFYNRLKRGMRLETDPAVIYGVRNFDGNLTRKHLETPGPYNTYLIKGLPPGPIANPGKQALEAALFPAETSYLFFVSRNDGTHQFSTHLAEHNRAVHYYQQGPGRAGPAKPQREPASGRSGSH